MRKLKDSYIFSLVLLSMIIVACSSGMESSEKIEEIEIEESALPIDSAPGQLLPLIKKTEDVSKFLSTLITTQDFQNFNGENVKFDDASKVKYILEANRTNDETIVDLFEWGRIKEFAPAECEFFNVTEGSTPKLTDSGAIKGLLFAFEQADFTRTNFNRARLFAYSHTSIVFDNFDVSNDIWNLTLSAYGSCLEGYTKLHIDGKIDDQANETKSALYVNEDKTLLVAFSKSQGAWDMIVRFKQGGTNDLFRFITGAKTPKDGSFAFLNDLVQKVVDENARIQNIEPIKVDLSNLETFVREKTPFVYPNLGLGGAI